MQNARNPRRGPPLAKTTPKTPKTLQNAAERDGRWVGFPRWQIALATAQLRWASKVADENCRLGLIRTPPSKDEA